MDELAGSYKSPCERCLAFDPVVSAPKPWSTIAGQKIFVPFGRSPRPQDPPAEHGAHVSTLDFAVDGRLSTTSIARSNCHRVRVA